MAIVMPLFNLKPERANFEASERTKKSPRISPGSARLHERGAVPRAASRLEAFGRRDNGTCMCDPASQVVASTGLEGAQIRCGLDVF